MAGCEALELDLHIALESRRKRQVFGVDIHLSVTQVPVQIDGARSIAQCLVYYREVRTFDEEERAPVSQSLITLVLGDQGLHLAFGLPAFRVRYAVFQVLPVQRQGIVRSGAAEPVAQAGHFLIAFVHIRT